MNKETVSTMLPGIARLPARLAATEAPWLPARLERLRWTCDRFELLAYEMLAERIWSRLRAAREADAAEFRFTLPATGEEVVPGDVVQYEGFMDAIGAHRALHLGKGFVVHLTLVVGPCTCAAMSPPGSHGGKGTRARIVISHLSEKPWFSQCWVRTAHRADAASVPERIFRALSSIGAVNYNLIYANCDHFMDAILDPVASRAVRQSRRVVRGTVQIVALLLMIVVAAALLSAVRRRPEESRLLQQTRGRHRRSRHGDSGGA